MFFNVCRSGHYGRDTEIFKRRRDDQGEQEYQRKRQKAQKHPGSILSEGGTGADRLRAGERIWNCRGGYYHSARCGAGSGVDLQDRV